jgi:NodT family efflux transporter outer membrane factor (OMF) lipoprotein
MKASPTLLALLFLAGCSAVGPDYTPQAAPTLPVEILVGEGPEMTSLARWWEVFQDPTLNQLITQGLEASPTVEAALERLRSARASREGAESDYYPTFTADGSYTWSRNWDGAPESKGWNDRSGANLNARWELDIFGGVRRSVEQALAREEQLAYTLQDVRVSLMAEIATAYVDVRRYAEQVRIAEDNLELQERSTRRTKLKVDNGDIPPYDYYSSEAQVARTRASIPLIKQNLRAAQLRLDWLTGNLPYATQPLMTSTKDQMRAPMHLPRTSNPNELLRRRADIRSAEAAIHAQTAAVGMATAELYPKFFLSGSVGISAPNLSLWEDYTRALSVGPSLSWNLFSFGFWTSQIEAQKATLRATIADYKKTVLTAYQESETAWHACQHEMSRHEDLALAESATAKALDVANRRYDFGEADIEDVLTQQANLLTTQENVVLHRANIFNHIISLYRALGGGWSDLTVEAEATTQP